MKKPLIAILATCFAAAAAAAAPPPNDLFANRIVLSGTNVTVAGTNSWEAGTEPGEDAGSGFALFLYSVWYEWTAPTNGILHLSGSTTVWNFYMSARVFRGTSVEALTPVGAMPDGGVPVAAGDTLAIQVASLYYTYWGGGGGAGPFTLTLQLEEPSYAAENDAFESRFEVTVPDYLSEGGIYGATTQPGEPVPAGTSQTLWWKFVAPEPGVLLVSASAPQFNPVLTLYEGTELTALVPVSPAADNRYRLEANHEYALQMASGPVPGGAFALNTRFFTITNDFFAGSTRLKGTNITYIGNLTTATFEANEPDPGATNTIWVSWEAPFTGRARFSGSLFDLGQPGGLYTGPTLGTLQPVRFVGNANNRYDFLAVAGTVYHFQIAGSHECNLFVQLFEWGPATNDFFASARQISGQWVNLGLDQEVFEISDATAELGEPEHLGGTPFKSLWWRWTAPVHGRADFVAQASLATNVTLAVYTGERVEALALRASSAGAVSFDITGGDVYYIAAAVPTNALGDVLLYGQVGQQSSASRLVPGNLLREPSWEGTALLNAQFWGVAGSLGGAVNEVGCDGTTWPSLGNGTQIWQDFGTVPGREYRIRLAMRAHSSIVGWGAEDGRVRVLWDGEEVGVAIMPEENADGWNWAELTATASYPTSRVTFINIGRNIELDAFSVVAMDEPTQIVTQPSSASAFLGGSAALVVGATGSSPLTYHWSLNDVPFTNLTHHVLILDPVTTNHAGVYRVAVSNAFGSDTSVPVTLTVEAPTTPVILWQPYGDVVGVGGFHAFSVVAAGTPPLSYQWFKNNEEISGANEKTLTFATVDYTNAGTYVVQVQNNAGIVWSLQAGLSVTNAIEGGGVVDFRNRYIAYAGFTNSDAPVFDVDGSTPLNGAGFVAQLYGGPSLELLRPAGAPSAFKTGFNAGYFDSQLVILPAVPPGSTAVLQVRAWDARRGSTYEEARALGGRFGKSELLTVPLGGGPLPPAMLQGLQSFSLKAGVPQFASGRISFVERQPEGIVVWAHEGQAGFQYLIEKSVHGFEWRPFNVITNETSVTRFTDSAESGASIIFYRSRILD